MSVFGYIFTRQNNVSHYIRQNIFKNHLWSNYGKKYKNVNCFQKKTIQIQLKKQQTDGKINYSVKNNV